MATINSMPKAKGNLAATPPPKPYTEYTIFFRLERAHLVQSAGQVDEEVIAALDLNHRDALEFPRPQKYTTIIMSPYWYSSAHKMAIEKKRKHRKRGGRMDLKTLSKTISARWRNIAPDIKMYCRRLAQSELRKYNELMEIHLRDRKINNVFDLAVATAGSMPPKKREVSPDNAHVALGVGVYQPAAEQVDNTTNTASRFRSQPYLMSGQDANASVDDAYHKMCLAQQLRLAHEKSTQPSSWVSSNNKRKCAILQLGPSNLHMGSVMRTSSGNEGSSRGAPDVILQNTSDLTVGENYQLLTATALTQLSGARSMAMGAARRVYNGGAGSRGATDARGQNNNNLILRRNYQLPAATALAQRSRADRILVGAAQRVYNNGASGTGAPDGTSHITNNLIMRGNEQMLPLPRSIQSNAVQRVYNDGANNFHQARIHDSPANMKTRPYHGNRMRAEERNVGRGQITFDSTKAASPHEGVIPVNPQRVCNGAFMTLQYHQSKRLAQESNVGTIPLNSAFTKPDSHQDETESVDSQRVNTMDLHPHQSKRLRAEESNVGIGQLSSASAKAPSPCTSPVPSGVQGHQKCDVDAHPCATTVPSSLQVNTKCDVDLQDHHRKIQSSNPISLFLPSDFVVLNPVQNFIRCHCIKLYEIKESDAMTVGRFSCTPNVGQVGLSCFYCKKMSLPSKLDSIFETCEMFQTTHIGNCPSMPPKMKAKYKAIVEQQDRIPPKNLPLQFMQAYYAEAALEIGMIDTMHGIAFGGKENKSSTPSEKLQALIDDAVRYKNRSEHVCKKSTLFE